MNLSQIGKDKAAGFIKTSARPLEQALYSYHFERGSADAVLRELAAFQNADGGFGRALEPDLRMPDSSAIASSVGLQVLREVKATEDHPLVRGVIQYLLDSYDPAIEAWPIIPPAANDWPHAPWWNHDGNLSRGWNSFLANPRAELVGYLHDYRGLVPPKLLDQLTTGVVAHLESVEKLEMHDLLCYNRFVETASLPAALRDRVIQRLSPHVDRAVEKNPANFGGYCLKPLTIAPTLASPFAGQLAAAIAQNLDYEIANQQPDGSWVPNWSWGPVYPETWPQARRDAAGFLTLRTLLALRAHGRLAQ